MASLLSRSRISKVNCTPILQVFGIGRSFLANVMVRDFFSCFKVNDTFFFVFGTNLHVAFGINSFVGIIGIICIIIIPLLP